MVTAKIDEYVEKNAEKFEDELVEVLKIPSISALPQHEDDVRKTAQWFKNRLESLGFDGEIYEAKGNPVVFMQNCPHDSRPTVLFYGHYDVQPVDPLDEWRTEPFKPKKVGSVLYARGASDDKGQILTAIHALEAFKNTGRGVPLNVKFVIEGAEESGSRNFDKFLKDRQDRLAADAVVVLDTSQYQKGVPAITYGLRGNVYMQIDVQGPKFDLHSGSYGGCVRNPVIALVMMLDRMKTIDNKVAIPGFYDNVADPEEWERKEFAGLPYDPGELKSYLGVDTLLSEPGYSILESMMLRPTFDICGIWGGFSGEGSKTIIPARAGAKISMRLAPNQDPDRIAILVERFVKDIAPDGVEVNVTKIQGMNPLFVNRDQDIFKAMHKAIEAVYKRPPVYIRAGGSIGVANMFNETPSVGSVMMTGWGSPDDGIHSPNEHFDLNDFHRGIKVCCRFMEGLST